MHANICSIGFKLALVTTVNCLAISLSSAITVPGYTESTRPTSTPATVGRLIRLLDSSRGLYLDTGAQWVSLTGNVANVRDFGAIGTGGGDDRAAIQAAIDAAAVTKGTVFFPPGTYVVGQRPGAVYALQLKSSTQLVGAGRGASIIKLDTMPKDSWVRVLSGTAISDLTIRDLAVDGNYLANASGKEQMAGIFLDGCTNVMMENLSLQNTRGDGILLYGGCKKINISHNFFDGNHRDGIALTGHQNVIVHGNHFRNISSTAIDNESDNGQSSDIVITSNFVDASVLHGISIGANPVESFRRVTVHGNIINAGVDIIRAESVDLIGNVIQGQTDGPALVISHSVSNVRILGNQISSISAQPAITVFASAPSGTVEIPQYIVISSNAITTTSNLAVELKGISNVVVQGNLISGSGSGRGVLLYATVPKMRDIVISENLIQGFATGVFASATSNNRIDGLSVVNNQISAQAAGVELATTIQFVDNLTLSNNNVDDATVLPMSFNGAQLFRLAGNARLLAKYSGAGTPEGSLEAPVGSTFLRRDGSVGASLYVKESGSGSIGWVNK